MIDWVEVLKIGIGPVSAIAGGAGVWSYLAARQTAKAPATIVASQASMAAALSEQTKLLLLESAKDRRLLTRRLDRQSTALAKVTADVAECNGKHAECESNVAALKAEVAKLAPQVLTQINVGGPHAPD